MRTAEEKLYYTMLDAIWDYTTEVTAISFGDNQELAEAVYSEIIEDVQRALEFYGVK